MCPVAEFLDVARGDVGSDKGGLAAPSWSGARATHRQSRRRSPHRAAKRRLQYLQRNFGFGDSQLQGRKELRRIPPGTRVVPIIVKSPKRLLESNPEILDGLGFGPSPRPGRFGEPFLWKPSDVGLARFSHWVFFDPGDDVLKSIRRSLTMRVTEYDAIGGRGLLVEPTDGRLDPVSGWIRFESGEHGYGASWPTTWSAAKAISVALRYLPTPSEGDAALIVSNEERLELPSTEVVAALAERDPLFVSLAIGNAVLNWTEKSVDPERPASRELDFGDQVFKGGLADRLITRTFPGPSVFVRDALEQAATILGPG